MEAEGEGGGGEIGEVAFYCRESRGFGDVGAGKGGRGHYGAEVEGLRSRAWAACYRSRYAS